MERLTNNIINKAFFFFLGVLSITSIAFAKVGAHKFDTQIEKAESVVTGVFKEDHQSKIIFVVESAFKGELKPGNSIVIDKNSKLAWRLLLGGGMQAPTDDAEFIQAIKNADWYTKKVALVGKVVDGKWVSCCYDWSVWASGKSTGEKDHKELSLEELIAVIKAEVEELKAPQE